MKGTLIERDASLQRVLRRTFINVYTYDHFPALDPDVVYKLLSTFGLKKSFFK